MLYLCDTYVKEEVGRETMRGRDTGMEEERGTETVTDREAERQTDRDRKTKTEIDFLCTCACSDLSLL